MIAVRRASSISSETSQRALAAASPSPKRRTRPLCGGCGGAARLRGPLLPRCWMLRRGRGLPRSMRTGHGGVGRHGLGDVERDQAEVGGEDGADDRRHCSESGRVRDLVAEPRADSGGGEGGQRGDAGRVVDLNQPT